MFDNQQYAVDEQSQVPPHLLPPPYLVDIDGNAHLPKYQEAVLRPIRPAKLTKVNQSEEKLEDYDDYMRKRMSAVKVDHIRLGHKQQARVGIIQAGGKLKQHTENMEASSRDNLHLQAHGGIFTMTERNSRNIFANVASSPKEEIAAIYGCCSSSLDAEGEVGGISADRCPSNGVSACSDDQKLFKDLGSRSVDPEKIQNLMSVGNPGVGNGSAVDTDEGSHVADSDNGKAPVLLDVGKGNHGEEARGTGSQDGSWSDVDVVEEESPNSQHNMQNMLSSIVYSLGLNETETKQMISLWINRTIIPHLGYTQIGHELAKRKQLYLEEQQNHDFQNMKVLLREKQVCHSLT